MVLLNGLRLTVAFFHSKSEKNKSLTAHGLYLRDLGEALGTSDLMRSLPGNSTEYRILTSNALKAAAWFKRYAEAVLKVEATSE
jgi:CRISPR-associated protein Cmr5